MNWENPGIALITGASAGIGAEFARALAAQGFSVILTARRREKLEEVAREVKDNYGVEAEVFPADLSKMEDIEKLVNHVQGLKKLDVLINNAGFGISGFLNELDTKPILDMMSVHDTAPILLCKAALPTMLEQDRGAIINVASLACFLRFPSGSIYNATKSFLIALTQSLHLDLHGTGIKVQALCPGMTVTEFHSVGYFEGFDRSTIPKWLWMSSEKTVRQSLAAFRKNKVVFIPGRKNRLFKSLYNSRIIGGIIRKSAIKRQQESF
ncbi:MAG: SDR family NAD(P)-dependent oxidoreductase [Candidatus Helarchaeota archaeon]